MIVRIILWLKIYQLPRVNLYCVTLTKCYHLSIKGVALLGANSDINEAHSLSYKREIVDIYSNSWGPYDSGDNVEGPGHLTKMALESGVKQVAIFLQKNVIYLSVSNVNVGT